MITTSAATSTSGHAQSSSHLKIGTTPIAAAMGIFAAQRSGIFRKRGLDVDLQSAAVGASMPTN